VARQLYLYGVVRDTGAQLELPAGVAGGAPFLHVHRGIAAIVSPLDADAAVGGPADVRAHEQVLRSALEAVDPVLPLRFDGVYPDADALDERLLEPASDELVRLLGELDGLVELELRALYPDQEALIRELVLADRGLVRLRERARGGGYHAQIELGEATVAAFERRRTQDQDSILGRLAPLALEWKAREELPERVAAQFAFLVRRDRLTEFEREAERLAEAVHERMRLSLVGPLPAYSFVAFELEPAAVR